MIRIGFEGSTRWLSQRCLEVVAYHPHVRMAWITADRPKVAHPGDSRMPLQTAPRWTETAEADLVFSVLTPRIFRPHEIQAHPIVNLHPAPLPEYRGCNTYAWAIENADPYYGVTLHYVDEGIDTGPIIAQAFVPIQATDTGWDLYRRAQCAALDLFGRELDRILEAHLQGGMVPARPQDEGRAHYWKRSVRLGPAERVDDRSRRAWTFPGYA